MPESNDLQASLNALNSDLDELNELISAQNAKLDAQAMQLKAIKEVIPTFVQRGRFHATIGGAVVAAILVVSFMWWNRQDARLETRREQRQEMLFSAARAYANCEAVNRAFHGVDVGYTRLFGYLSMNAETQASRDRIEQFHELAREGLERTNCEGHLANLSEADRTRVKTAPASTLPTLPLPPPPQS